MYIFGDMDGILTLIGYFVLFNDVSVLFFNIDLRLYLHVIL